MVSTLETNAERWSGKNLGLKREPGILTRDISYHACSTTMKHALEKAGLVAQSNSIVLLLGGSGSGKDYLARYIHDHSNRSDGLFLSINCAAFPHDLAETELFGHEDGAFTSALAGRDFSSNSVKAARCC